MMRIMIVDDHQLFVDALCSLLEDEQEIAVVAKASSPDQALDLIKQHRPDIVLMDISFQNADMDGLEAAELIYEHCPSTRVMMLTASDRGRHIARTLRQKISGYMLKNTAAKELVKALRTICRGESYYSVEVMKAHMDYVSMIHQRGGPTVKVTKREQEVLQLIVEELSTGEIGERLNIGEAGVETHRRNLRQKFEVKNTAGLVREAILQDLVDLKKFK